MTIAIHIALSDYLIIFAHSPLMHAIEEDHVAHESRLQSTPNFTQQFNGKVA